MALLYTCMCAAILLFATLPSSASPYKDLIPNYTRLKSPVLARSIDVPTRANLDFAAYSANPVRLDPTKYTPKKPAKRVQFSELTYKNALSDLKKTLQETPLTEVEKQQPFAWVPVQNLLWSELKIDEVSKVGTKIISEKWADPEIFRPYQDIEAFYIHKENTAHQIWVEVEVSSWVTFIDGIVDGDKDGFKEFYARLNTDSIAPATMEKMFQWLEKEYATTVLTKEQVVEWANVLASYWYPTLNTDMFPMNQNTQWPTPETEKEVVLFMKGLKISQPLAVIRGVPNNKPLYNLFVVPSLQQNTKTAESTSAPVKAGGTIDTSLSTNFKQNNDRFVLEVKEFSTYADWYKANAPVVTQVKKVLSGIPENQMAIMGSDGWLFFRKSLEYVIAPDMAKQAIDKNPVPHLVEFKQYLAKNGINLLFVPVPQKEELYPEKLGITPVDKKNHIVNVHGRKLLSDLQAQGVEVIDLLPALLEAKTQDPKDGEYLFQLHDTHWSFRGVKLASDRLAERIKQYGWYTELSKTAATYSVKDTTFERQGDIIDKLPEKDKAQFKPVTLHAQRVYTASGAPYASDPKGPILLIGDSFTGVFELIDCKSAGMGAHIAQKTGLGVDIITSWGGGPMVRTRMARSKKNELPSKRLVIYMMTARDLNNYSQGWDKLDTK